MRFILGVGSLLAVLLSVSSCAAEPKSENRTSPANAVSIIFLEDISRLEELETRSRYRNSMARLDSVEERNFEFQYCRASILTGSVSIAEDLGDAGKAVLLSELRACGAGDEIRALVLARVAGAAGLPFDEIVAHSIDVREAGACPESELRNVFREGRSATHCESSLPA